MTPEKKKLHFTFTNSDGNDETESMWATRVDDGYEIDNIPFYVKNFAVGDVVSADGDAEGTLWAKDLVRASGHSTIRVLVEDEADVQAVRDELRKMGCPSELSDHPQLIAVDVSPSVPYEQVKPYLDQREAGGRFEYQEACLGFL